MRKTNNVFAGLIVGPIIAVIGFCVAFLLGKPMLDNAKQSTSWPTASGVVTHSDIDRRLDKGKTRYSAEIAYRFSVNGQEFVGNTVSYGAIVSSSDSNHVRRVTDRYPVGGEIDVYYDSVNPDNNVLEPGTKGSSFILYGVGWLFLIVGVLIFATSAFTILAGAAIIGGAAAGALGSSKRSRNPRDLINTPNFDSLGPQPDGGNDQPGDDGIDIG